ncbi:CoxG family protein [Halobaculum sp. P14]|uniref:CoxG family protein n=1 Tax=Halobaculum sp. P14 TaxID=3421638 RepID=UPI003EB910D6
MNFSGTFHLDETTPEDVWLALSDPVLIERALPGCQFLVRVDDTDVDFDALREETADRTVAPTADPAVIEERAFEEGGHYAALLQLSVGPINPTFETVVTVDRREFPEMSASGEGSSSNSSFELSSGMTLAAADGGVDVDWETDAEVFGKVAQMGQRVVNPVANRVVKRFFSSVQDELHDLRDPEAAAGDAGDGDADGADGDDAAGDGEGDGADESGGGRGIVDRVLGRSNNDSQP